MYSMKDICKTTGMTYQTLKFYCNEGLIPNVKRDANNRRIFGEDDLTWIRGLTCLKKCGFSIAEMKTFLELCLQGESSIPARQQMLDSHRIELLKKIEEITISIDYIDKKKTYYQTVSEGTTKYVQQFNG